MYNIVFATFVVFAGNVMSAVGALNEQINTCKYGTVEVTVAVVICQCELKNLQLHIVLCIFNANVMCQKR